MITSYRVALSPNIGHVGIPEAMLAKALLYSYSKQQFADIRRSVYPLCL